MRNCKAPTESRRCGGRRRAQEGLAAVPVGGGGAWPDNEPTHEPHISDQAPLVWRAPEGARGPGCGARGRWRGLAGQRADAPNHASATRRRRCGGRRRVRRARAGFEIDHSEPQARVWRSRGRPGPTVPRTPAAPQATSSIANSGCAAGADGSRAGRRPRRSPVPRPGSPAPGTPARDEWVMSA